jgi:hypothetical protein
VHATLIGKVFQKRSKIGGDGGTGVYLGEGTTWRVMVADRPYGEFMIFTASVRDVLESTTYIMALCDPHLVYYQTCCTVATGCQPNCSYIYIYIYIYQ